MFCFVFCFFFYNIWLSFSTLLRVSSTMGLCRSGNLPLCSIMFVLRFCFCFWWNKYSFWIWFRFEIYRNFCSDKCWLEGMQWCCIKRQNFFTNFAYRNDTAKAQREMWQGSCCHFIGKSIGEKKMEMDHHLQQLCDKPE